MNSEPLKRPDPTLHTFPISIFIPFSQALLTGVVAGILAFAFALTFHKENPLLWLLWGFLLPTALLWMLLLKRWIKLTDWLPTVERITNLDINRDDRIGDRLPPVNVVPEPKEITVTVRDVSDHGSLSVMRYAFPQTKSSWRHLQLGSGKESL